MNDSRLPAYQNTVGLSRTTVGGDQVILVIITPRILTPRVTHPYIFQVTDELVGQLQANRGHTSQLFAPGVMQANSAIASAIQPDAQGTGVAFDTTQLSNSWTFVLLVDTLVPSGVKRFILTGFFIDEPINRTTMHMNGGEGTLNPRAKMLVTNSYTVNHTPSLGPSPHHIPHQTPQWVVTSNMDHTPGGVHRAAASSLYMTDPTACAQFLPTRQNDHGNVLNYQNVALTSHVNRTRATPVAFRTPAQHLRTVGNALDNATGTFEAAGDAQHRLSFFDPFTSPGEQGDHQRFTTNLQSNLLSINQNIGGIPFSITAPFELDLLRRTYPNLQVMPLEVPHQTIQDERPQTLSCRENVYSFLTAQVVHATALSCNIGEIAFRYTSWTPEGKVGGSWEILHMAPVCRMESDAVMAQVNRFFSILAVDLWPMILNSQNGHFRVGCRHDSHGESFYDLVFYDFEDRGGLYYVNNAYGGVFLPVVGGLNILTNNMNGLQTMEQAITDSMGLDNPPTFGNQSYYETSPYGDAPLPMHPEDVVGSEDALHYIDSSPPPDLENPQLSNLVL